MKTPIQGKSSVGFLFIKFLYICFVILITYILANKESFDSIISHAAFVLVCTSVIYPLVFKFYVFQMKNLTDIDVNNKKSRLREQFKKVRPLLLWIHYYGGGVGILFTWIHGMLWFNNHGRKFHNIILVGNIVGAILLFYGISGILLKTRLRKLAIIKKYYKWIRSSHNSLIFLLIGIAIHVLHVIYL